MINRISRLISHNKLMSSGCGYVCCCIMTHLTLSCSLVTTRTILIQNPRSDCTVAYMFGFLRALAAGAVQHFVLSRACPQYYKTPHFLQFGVMAVIVALRGLGEFSASACSTVTSNRVRNPKRNDIGTSSVDQTSAI